MVRIKRIEREYILLFLCFMIVKDKKVSYS